MHVLWRSMASYFAYTCSFLPFLLLVSFRNVCNDIVAFDGRRVAREPSRLSSAPSGRALEPRHCTARSAAGSDRPTLDRLVGVDACGRVVRHGRRLHHEQTLRRAAARDQPQHAHRWLLCSGSARYFARRSAADRQHGAEAGYEFVQLAGRPLQQAVELAAHQRAAALGGDGPGSLLGTGGACLCV